jgi:hypothetical protein
MIEHNFLPIDAFIAHLHAVYHVIIPFHICLVMMCDSKVAECKSEFGCVLC